MTKVLRSPHQWPQTEVLTRNEREILYWWARWWGKTDAWIAWFLSRHDNPHLRALVLRHTYDDLKDWLDRAIQLYSAVGAKMVGNPAEIVFPSGAIIRTWYLKDAKSYRKIKGHEYQKMLIEEVTQVPSEELFEMLLGSLRSTVEGINPQIFLTTNPDWPGRLRVKRRYVDVVEPGKRYIDEHWNSRIYIPAKVTDNPTLIDNDPSYVNYLKSIKDDQLRKAWLEWDRDAYDVKWWVYTEQLRQAKQEERITRVPFEPHLEVNTARDIGVSDYTTIIFWQQYGQEIRIIDAEFGFGKWLPEYKRILDEKWYRYGRHFAPFDIKVKERGTWETRIDQAFKYGINFEPVKMVWKYDWIMKARQMFAYCYFDRIKCQTLLEHLQLYRWIYDEKRDIFKSDTEHWDESHYADAFRYMSLSIMPNTNRHKARAVTLNVTDKYF